MYDELYTYIYIQNAGVDGNWPCDKIKKTCYAVMPNDYANVSALSVSVSLAFGGTSCFNKKTFELTVLNNVNVFIIIIKL